MGFGGNNQLGSETYTGTVSRVLKYSVFRVLMLLLAVFIGVYLTIFVASRGSIIEGDQGDNLGGWLTLYLASYRGDWGWERRTSRRYSPRTECISTSSGG